MYLCTLPANKIVLCILFAIKLQKEELEVVGCKILLSELIKIFFKNFFLIFGGKDWISDQKISGMIGENRGGKSRAQFRPSIVFP